MNGQVSRSSRIPFREIQSNTLDNYPSVRKNEYVPPLLQTRPITGMTNPNYSVTREQAVHKYTASARNQKPSVYNRNSSVSETLYQSTIPQVFNRVNPGVSNAETYFGSKRGNAAISTGVSEMTVRDNAVAAGTSKTSSTAEFNSSVVTNQNNESATANNFNFKVFGSTESEKMFIFTGTVERVIKWNKIFRNHFCYYEVIASVVSIQEGSISTQKIMLLRDRKGPILQVVYYTSTHIDIANFHVEQVLRCVGRMSSPNILNAVSIRSATQEEIETLQRLCLVCDQAVSHFLSV